MPRGLDLTATQTLSTARFRAILVSDDLHYPFDFIGDPGRIRTCDHSLRRRVLYPAELRGHRLRVRLSAAITVDQLGTRS
jgi:hypothetical protein